MGARNRDAAVALAGNSTIAHCSRRDEVPVPPLLPALVALLLPPQRCARNIPATMCAASCVPHKAYSVAPSHLRFAPSSIARSAHSVAPSHLQSLFEGWHGVVVRSLDRQDTAPLIAQGTQPPRSLVRLSGLNGLKSFIYINPSPK